MFAPKRHAKALLSLVLAASLGFGAPAAFAAQQANGDSMAKVEKAEAITEQVMDNVDASDGISLASATSTIADEQELSSLANSANAWQVVNEGYTGNGTGNKTPSSDGNVAVQKNVVPAGTENEFLVYLSVDYKAALKNYFESATYEGTTSNNYHSETPGNLVHQMTGNMNVSISTTSGKKSGYFTVKTPSGETVAEKVHLYWSQANKVTFFLTIDSSNYVLFAVEVTDGSNSNVTLSTEAWDLIRQEAVKTALNQVTDTMGDNIEYVETVAADGTTAYDSDSKTLTWTPEVKATCETESSTSGSETITWYRNAAELVYKVRLTPPRSTGLTSGSDGSLSPADSDAAICDVNSKATLTYNSTSTVDFPVPQVKGLLYDLVFTKVAEGTNDPLPGAVFKLQRYESGTWQDVTDSSDNLITATSDTSGKIAFTDLQYGTYRAVETQAPAGYKGTDANGDPLTWEPAAHLCWTTSSANLTRSSIVNENVMAAESATATMANTRSMGLMVLKVDGKGNPLPGVTFTLTNNDGSTASAVTESKTVKKGSTSTTEGVAAASFATLDSGAYTLAESRVVAGYEVSSQSPYVITVNASGVTVSDSSGQPVVLNTLTCDGETFYYLTVTNYTLPALPETGGVGSICAYAIGSAALLLGIWLLVRRRRERAARS